MSHRTVRWSALMAWPLAVALLCAPAAADEATSTQNNPAHSGFADEPSLAPPLGKKWERNLGTGTSHPLILPGRVIVAGSDDDGLVELRALDPATGADVWRRPVSAPESSQLAADGGRVFLLDSQGALHAYAAEDGRELWIRSLPGDEGFLSSPVAAGGLVFLTGRATSSTLPLVRRDPYAAYALRGADGATAWQSGIGDDAPPSAAPALDPQQAVVPTDTGAAAFDRTSGARRWTHAESRAFSRGSPQVHSGRVYLTSGVVLSASSGARIGSYPVYSGDSGSFSSPAGALDGDLGFFPSSTGLLATDLATGVTRWSFKPPSSGPARGPLAAAGTAFTLGGSWVYGLERASGRTTWRSYLLDTPSALYYGSPAIAAGGGRMIVSTGAAVVAFGAGPTTPGLSLLPIRPNDGEIEAAPSRRRVIFGQRVVIGGNMFNGSSEFGSGDPAVLEADPFPFDGAWRAIRRKTIDDDSDFRFVVRPERNTRYRVRNAAYARFATKPFMVLSDYGLRIRYKLRGRSLRTMVTLVHSPRQRIVGRRMYFYLLRRGERPMLKQSRRVRRTRRRSVSLAVARFGIPTPRPGDRILPCLRERRNDGYGKHLALDRACGRPKL